MSKLTVVIAVVLGLITGNVLAITYDVVLDADQEVPTPALNGSTPAGTANVNVNTITGETSITGAYSGRAAT